MNNEDEKIFQFLIAFVEPLIRKLSGEEGKILLLLNLFSVYNFSLH